MEGQGDGMLGGSSREDPGEDEIDGWLELPKEVRQESAQNNPSSAVRVKDYPVEHIRQFTRRERAMPTELSKRASPVAVFPPLPLEVQERDTVREGFVRAPPRRRKPPVSQQAGPSSSSAAQAASALTTTTQVESSEPIKAPRQSHRTVRIGGGDSVSGVYLTLYEATPPAPLSIAGTPISDNAAAPFSRGVSINLPFPTVYELTREYEENQPAAVQASIEDQESIVIESDDDDDDIDMDDDDEPEVILLD